MRPRGKKREALSNFATAGGQFTMGQLAKRFNWSVREADKTLGRALASGEIRKAGTVRTQDAKRPVALYEAARALDDAAAALLGGVLQGWRP